LAHLAIETDALVVGGTQDLRNVAWPAPDIQGFGVLLNHVGIVEQHQVQHSARTEPRADSAELKDAEANFKQLWQVMPWERSRASTREL
jgi:hypothetical protein